MKIWIYKETRRPAEIGIIIKEGRYYYKIPFTNFLVDGSKKRKRLKKEFIYTHFSDTYTCFPYDCLINRCIESDKVYIHEILRLLKKLRYKP